MGSYAHGKLFFGAIFDDEYGETNMELPWDYDDDTKPDEVKDWWIEVNGQNFRDTNGEQMWEERHDWLRENPCPIDEIHVGDACGGFMQNGICLNRTHVSSSWCGNITDHIVKQDSAEDLEKEFRAFCSKYGIDLTGCNVGWQLSAYYG